MVKGMKKIYQSTLIFVIFFLCFIFKDYFYFLIGSIPKVTNEINNTESIILKAENEELKKEIESLNMLNNWEINPEFDYEISKVYLRNPLFFYESLVIENKNKELSPGMAVIGESGLIGRVGEVSEMSARVDLITKPKNDISVMVHGAYGILSGYSKEYECLIMKNFNNYSKVEVGDLIYTSGLSMLPGGILIGKVSMINYDRFKIEKNICVEYKIDLDNINYVGVIKKKVINE